MESKRDRSVFEKPFLRPFCLYVYFNRYLKITDFKRKILLHIFQKKSLLKIIVLPSDRFY